MRPGAIPGDKEVIAPGLGQMRAVGVDLVPDRRFLPLIAAVPGGVGRGIGRMIAPLDHDTHIAAFPLFRLRTLAQSPDFVQPGLWGAAEPGNVAAHFARFL